MVVIQLQQEQTICKNTISHQAVSTERNPIFESKMNRVRMLACWTTRILPRLRVYTLETVKPSICTVSTNIDSRPSLPRVKIQHFDPIFISKSKHLNIVKCRLHFCIEIFRALQSLRIKVNFPCSQTCYSSNSSSKGSNWGKKLRRYWSAVVTAGLFGIGAATFLYDPSKETQTLFVYCAPDEKCGCKKKKCDCKEKKCEESECLRKTECEEELIRKANSELDHALTETKGKAVEFTEAALKAYCDAIQMIKLFIDKVYCAAEEENLDSPRFVEVWCDVHKTLTKRCDLSKKAMEKGQCAWELLNRLRDIIECGKCCQYTSCNPLLVTAEETLICAEKEICDKKKMMEDLLKESRVMEQYRNIIEEFRRDLKGEADSLLPSQDCRVTKLNNNEINMILTHAYKKLLRVQAEVAKKEELKEVPKEEPKEKPKEADKEDNQDKDKC